MTSTVLEQNYDYGRINVTDEETYEGVIHALLLDGARESACYVDKGRHFDLRFAYCI